jgi:mRNA interferase MazF
MSEPGFARPVVIIQSNTYNRSEIKTVVIAVLTSNLNLESVPGYVFVPSAASGLAKDSVLNVSQLLTVDRRVLLERVGMLPNLLMDAVDAGLRRVLQL